MSKIIPYGHQSIDESDIQVVIKVLKADRITQGPEIDKFENALAKFVGAKYAVATSSGTAALHAACIACGITQGDEVIVPTLSFIASANCVLYCGGKPVLVDIYPDTLTINVEEVERKITKKTKAIIAVDFAGHPAHWDKLKKLASKYRLTLIDDASHAIGSKYKNKPIGSIADLTTFSFHPVKTITTGEGGMVTTNDEQLYKNLLIIRNQGQEGRYRHTWLGNNFRFTDIQAALGIEQLKRLEWILSEKAKIARNYTEIFLNVNGVIPPFVPAYVDRHSWYMYSIRVNAGLRDWLVRELQLKNIDTRLSFPPVHIQPYYQKRFGYTVYDFPVACKIFSEFVDIPIWAGMSIEKQEYIINTIRQLLIAREGV